MKNSFLLAVLVIIAGFLSYGIDADLSAAGVEGANDPLTRLMGGTKEAVGGALFLKADSYFHGGADRGDAKDTAEEAQREGTIEEERRDLSEDWISKINHQVKSHEHYHLKKEEQREMLPYFALATKLDLHNIDAILTVAYWLSGHLEKIDEAIDVLEEGIRNNPDSWELEYKLGEIYFKKEKNVLNAESHLLEASKKAQGHQLARHEYVDIYYYLGESYRFQNKTTEALEAYQLARKGYASSDESALKKEIEARITELTGGAIAG